MFETAVLETRSFGRKGLFRERAFPQTKPDRALRENRLSEIGSGIVFRLGDRALAHSRRDGCPLLSRAAIEIVVIQRPGFECNRDVSTVSH